LVERSVRRRFGVSLNRNRDLILRLEVRREKTFGSRVSRIARHVVELGRKSVGLLAVNIERIDVSSANECSHVKNLQRYKVSV